MFRNYLRVSLRNLLRQQGFSAINILGLATGMAAFVLIMLFVRHEISFDQHQEYADDIYGVVLDAEVMGRAVKTMNSAIPLAETLVDELPEVIAATRVDDFARILVSRDDKPFYEDNFVLADSSIFDVLTLPIVSGDAKNALRDPNTMVITEAAAMRYFGDEDALGKVLKVDNRTEYVITAVIRPENEHSHFRPDLIGSFVTSPRHTGRQWTNNTLYTYVRLAPGTDPSLMDEKMKALVVKYVAPEVEQFLGGSWEEAVAGGLRYDWHLFPVRDLYLRGEAGDAIGPTGDVRYVYILSIIAIFVLVIACINFVNLTTARAAGRAKEVGLRKVLGSERSQLIRQFFGESVLVVSISMLLALVMVTIVLPWFNTITSANLKLAPWVFVALIGITVVTGLSSGFYPALVLSKFRPAAVLKGGFTNGAKGSVLRSSLVVLQFVISVALLVGTGVVYKQQLFLQNQDLGFEKEQVVVLPIETQGFVDSFESFRDEALRQSGVVAVASSNGLPGPNHIHSNNTFRGEGANVDDVILSSLIEASYEYAEALGLEILYGRNFSRNFETDIQGFLVSETAAMALGWSPEEAVGKRLNEIAGNEDNSDRVGEVLGVFRDAHFHSFHEEIQPVVIGMGPSRRYIPVRILPGQTEEALASLEAIWTKFEPGYPFRYFFLDREYAKYYEQEARLGQIMGYFTILAIIISCLGLFGLSAYVTAQRRKEIGVRKVLGASVSSVVMLLSKDFTKLVLVACLVAFPIAYFAMDSWLQSFAYATDIGWGVFALAGFAAFAIAWLTVGYQSVRAAIADPVRSLRYE